jgi:hypothetical protein
MRAPICVNIMVLHPQRVKYFVMIPMVFDSGDVGKEGESIAKEDSLGD